MFEVFDPRHGDAMFTVPDERAAKRLTAMFPWLDYAREGEGWC